MDYVLPVDVVQGTSNLDEDLPHFGLWQVKACLPSPLKKLLQVSLLTVLHYEVQVVLGDETLVITDYILVPARGQDLDLIEIAHLTSSVFADSDHFDRIGIVVANASTSVNLAVGSRAYLGLQDVITYLHVPI